MTAYSKNFACVRKLIRSCIDAQNSKEQLDSAFLVSGAEGCLSGDTIIRINRGGNGCSYSLKYLYNQYNNNVDNIKGFNQWDLSINTNVRSFLGNRIGLHKILNVVYSGKKNVYLVTLECGKSIKATSDHKFMTSKGFVEVKDLLDCDVMIDTPNAKISVINKHKFHDIQIGGLIYHSFGGKRRIEIHRLIFEANLNNLTFTKYIEYLSNNKDLSNTFVFVNPNSFVIHHKDFNHYNNDVSNLEMLTKDEHLLVHSKNAYEHFSQGKPEFSKVKSVLFVGLEDTYDIMCAEPYHNFNANDIIVHNSGKSNFMLSFIDEYEKETGKDISINNVSVNLKDLILSLSKDSKSIHALDEGEELNNLNHDRIIKLSKQVFVVSRARAQISLISYPNPFKINAYFKEDRAKGVFFCYKRKYVYFFSRDQFRHIRDVASKNYNVKSINDFVEIYGNYAMLVDLVPEYKGHLLKDYLKRKDDNINKVFKDVLEEIGHKEKTYSLRTTLSTLGICAETLYEAIDKGVIIPEWNATHNRMRLTEQSLVTLKEHFKNQATRKCQTYAHPLKGEKKIV